MASESGMTLAERLRKKLSTMSQADTLGMPDPFRLFWENVAAEALAHLRAVLTREATAKALYEGGHADEIGFVPWEKYNGRGREHWLKKADAVIALLEAAGK